MAEKDCCEVTVISPFPEARIKLAQARGGALLNACLPICSSNPVYLLGNFRLKAHRRRPVFASPYLR